MTNPNNFVVPEHKLVFFGTPKTASSSQKKAVALTFGRLAPDEVKGEGKGGGLPLKVVNKRFEFWPKHKVDEVQQADAEWLSFVVVRNPYDRFVSLWNERVRPRERGHWKRNMPGGLSLEELAEWLSDKADDEVDHHCRTQASANAIDGRMVPKVVMRFETLAEDWKGTQRLVRERTGHDLPDLDRLRDGERKNSYRDVMTDRCRALVEQRYAEDFALLGYGW